MYKVAWKFVPLWNYKDICIDYEMSSIYNSNK